MYLSIATTLRPARDLGFLLHKHPDRLHVVGLPFGRAVMFYPRADDDGCEFVLSVDVDPVAMVRERDGGPDAYVNDRPYAASSFLSTALAKTLGTARSGRCEARQDLADSEIPLTVTVGGLGAGSADDASVHRMFGPLGYDVSYAPLVAASPVGAIQVRAGTLVLRATARLRDVLDHVYVLAMAVDGDRHTFVDAADMDRVVSSSPWLRDHPYRDAIVRRLSKGIRDVADDAIARMDGSFAFPPSPPEADALGATLEAKRRNFVVAQVARGGDPVVADLGCGEGKTLRRLRDMPAVRRWIAFDASARVVERLRSRVADGEFGPPGHVRIEVVQGMLSMADARLADVGTAILAEVIEHVDPVNLPAFRDAVFGRARPARVVLTTPNAEYNVVWGFEEGRMRHPDHRFEWTRDRFDEWVAATAALHGYSFEIHGVGDPHPDLGCPTQAAVFVRSAAGGPLP